MVDMCSASVYITMDRKEEFRLIQKIVVFQSLEKRDFVAGQELRVQKANLMEQVVLHL